MYGYPKDLFFFALIMSYVGIGNSVRPIWLGLIRSKLSRISVSVCGGCWRSTKGGVRVINGYPVPKYSGFAQVMFAYDQVKEKRAPANEE